jgi:protein-S-isoprenylcysteine O-methyltransferase Ste14
MWMSWAAYWWAASYTTKITDRREPLGSRLLHVLPLLLSGWLLWSDRVDGSFLDARMFPWTPGSFWAGTLVTAIGLLFAVWARIHLGRNWSGSVTIKRDHELIMSGPYAAVRHPIYTGLLLALSGTAMARGEWRGLVAVLIAGAALWRKLRVEERWMRERFGQQYAAYGRRVPALVPRFKGWGNEAQRKD